METVLGLSVTATNVQTVLVEGRDAAGATLEDADFEVFTPDVSVAEGSERVAELVVSIAAADGHQLSTIAVTHSEDADLEAALVLDALAQAGIDQTVPIVAVEARTAAAALAHSIGDAIGYRRTAVCVVEPESALLSLIDTTTGDLATLSTRIVPTADALTVWIGSVFSGAGWDPDGVFLVGSVGGLSALADRLSADLGVPVFNPPGAELALAHGATMAFRTETVPVNPGAPAARRATALPLTMMTAGAAAFVVSTALLVSPALLPERPPLAARTVVQFRDAGTPQRPAAAPKPPAPAPAAAPAPVPDPVEPAEAPTPEPLVADVPAPARDAQFAVPVVPEAPAPEAAPVLPPAPVAVPVLPPPQAVAPSAPWVPGPPPRLRDRIRDKIDKIGDLARLGRGQ